MPSEIDEQIKLQMAQEFATNHAIMQQTASRFNDGSGFAAQESKQGFLLQEKVIGAAMVQLIEKNALADDTTQLKSAGNFPPNTNGGAVGVKTT